MLVLGRRQGESIVIALGEDLVLIQVTLADRGKARIAISAPDYVDILRGEVMTAAEWAAVRAVLDERAQSSDRRRWRADGETRA